MTDPTTPVIDQRRSSDNPALLLLIQTVHTDVKAFKKQLDEQRHDDALSLASAVVALTLKAFPEGDADGHRKAHEAQMAAISARAEFWQKMVFEISKWGLIGFCGWVALKLWTGFIAGPGK